MNLVERIINRLNETRSAESRAKTKGRKMFGTKGRRGRLTDRTPGEMQAHGAGQAAGKLIGRARTREKAAGDIDTHHKVGSGPKASAALRSHAKQLRQSAGKKMAQGRKAVSFERGQRIFKKMDARDEARQNTKDFRSGTLSQRRGK